MKMIRIILILLLVELFLISQLHSWDGTEPLIIDHTCTDLSMIPYEWINAVKDNMRLHYGHTSHGGQLTGGLLVIEGYEPFFSYAIGDGYLPTEAGAFCIYDEAWVTPIHYWSTASGMDYTSSILYGNPTINASMFGWCSEIPGYDSTQVQAYLDSMTVLEGRHPGVTFIYQTGNAQSGDIGGHWRFNNNNMIRQYCIDNNKVLFDFADLDCWWFNPDTQEWEHNVYESYDSIMVPKQHPQFNGNEWGHTTWESCEQKGKATWWMMARIAGWSGSVITDTDAPAVPSAAPMLYQNYPNPFNPTTAIKYYLPDQRRVTLNIYDAAGRHVTCLLDDTVDKGSHTLHWDGKDDRDRPVSSGIYFCMLAAGDKIITKKMLLIR